MNESSHFVTLSDYLRVLRRQRHTVVLAAVVAAVAALAYSLSQAPTYEAKASLAFRDESRDVGLLGAGLPPSEPPAQIAAANASAMTRPSLLLKVRRDLRTSVPVDELRRSVKATPDPNSNLVVVEAKGPTASFAARFANALARRTRNSVNARSRARFAFAARALRRRLGSASGDAVTRALLAEELSRVQALSSFASPAQIVALAERPSAPVSPRPVRNTILGALLGLLLGVCLAFLRDSMDRRLRGSHEVQSNLQLPLLGLIRAEALGKVAHLTNGREELSRPDLEAFRILRTNFEFLDVDSQPRTVAVTSSLPEEGKTTVASSLAFAAAAAGKVTLLVECDLRRPVLAGRLGLQSSPGLTDFLSRQASPQEVVQTITFEDPPVYNEEPPNGKRRKRKAGGDDETSSRPEHRLACITSGSPTPHPAELLGSKRFRSFLRDVAQVYELVVLDSSPLLPVADTMELVPNVDSVLVCVRTFRTTRDQALAGKAVLDRLPPRPTGLVVIGAHRGEDSVYGYDYPYAYDYSSDRRR